MLVCFVMFYVGRKALSSDVCTYIKDDTMPNTGMCQARVCACTSYNHLPSRSLVPQAVRPHCYNILRCDSLGRKPSLTWLGFDPVSYSTYLELKGGNPLG